MSDLGHSAVEAQTTSNNATVLASAICDAAWAGTTQEKGFYKTLATSLNDARPGEDRESALVSKTAEEPEDNDVPAKAETNVRCANTAIDADVAGMANVRCANTAIDANVAGMT